MTELSKYLTFRLKGLLKLCPGYYLVPEVSLWAENLKRTAQLRLSVKRSIGNACRSIAYRLGWASLTCLSIRMHNDVVSKLLPVSKTELLTLTRLSFCTFHIVSPA